MLCTLDKAIWLDRYVRMYINIYIYIHGLYFDGSYLLIQFWDFLIQAIHSVIQ